MFDGIENVCLQLLCTPQQETAEKRPDIFFDANCSCPVGKQVWFYKETNDSGDVAGPFTIGDCDQDDRG